MRKGTRVHISGKTWHGEGVVVGKGLPDGEPWIKITKSDPTGHEGEEWSAYDLSLSKPIKGGPKPKWAKEVMVPRYYCPDDGSPLSSELNCIPRRRGWAPCANYFECPLCHKPVGVPWAE